jgi:C-terminal processing protease CtpA/Prc
MLNVIAADVKKHYYDPKYHGIDWESKTREMKQKIEQSETSNRALSEIAALLDSLNDSHTFFLPPAHATRHDYGWKAQLIGGRCYIVHVRPGSDAESKGIKPGDEIIALNGYSATKDNFWRMEYVFETLRPQAALQLDLRDPSGKGRNVEPVTKFTESRQVKDLTASGGGGDIWDLVRESEDQAHTRRAHIVEMGDELMILKFPSFFFDESEVDSMTNKASKHKTLIIDLRENGGGSVDTLKFLLGRMFDKEIKIGDRVGREEHKSMVTKPHGHRFEGKLIVLTDSRSASASEIFARAVQIEKRGVVIGDVSSGKVMESKRYSYQVGLGTVSFYGASITDADIIMTDGKSLENIGVNPDEVVLPTAADLANDRDPVLAHAAQLAGVRLSPEAAGKMFPYEWPHE